MYEEREIGVLFNFIINVSTLYCEKVKRVKAFLFVVNFLTIKKFHYKNQLLRTFN